VALEGYLPRVRNFNVAVSEDKGEVVFLHKIIQGGVDKSYGIHVAKLAGLPRPVIKRATEVLADLENHDQIGINETVMRPRQSAAPQLSFFAPKTDVVKELEKLEIDTLSPLEALSKLYELQKKAKEG
jgi:DNA mismatch repair protein MutS